jgi:predicted secreted hydrolase
MKRSMWLMLVGCAAALAIIGGIVAVISSQLGEAEPQGSRIDIMAALSGGDTEGYEKADRPIELSFPEDHGAHPGFRNEWWYFTGNLYDEYGRRFGYQLTFFRIALSPIEEDRESSWATNQVYMAHFAISDTANHELYCFDLLNRAALGLAGFQDEGFELNVEDWYIIGTGEGDFPWQLYATNDDITLSIEVNPLKGIVLEGDNGLSRKSLDESNASYYYSITRLYTEGYIEIDSQRFDVSGNSWLDREWSTSALSQEQGGWDWFALQLDDGSDIVYFQLRYKDGSTYPYNEGLIVAADGSTTRLGTGDIPLEVIETWSNPLGSEYPVVWQAEVAPLGKWLIIEAVFPEQELDLNTRYWEGAVDIYDQASGEAIGVGYMEMTGYS